jgi:myosin heavy subunit
MVLNFDQHNRIHSSNVVSYLLEKSRVTKRESKERNYHIFYQILRGLDAEQLQQWQVSSDLREHRYTMQGDGKEPQDLDDAAQFAATRAAFSSMGFSEGETLGILRVVCAILLVGNVAFDSTNEGEGSCVRDVGAVEGASSLLGLQTERLSHALCTRSIESRKTTIAILLSAQKAAESRDSLSRQLYDTVFLSVISRINQHSTVNEAVDRDSFDRCIGLLDIFGFEIFVENSFEQVCLCVCICVGVGVCVCLCVYVFVSVCV